jgi:hypothetical protein
MQKCFINFNDVMALPGSGCYAWALARHSKVFSEFKKADCIT